MRRITQEELRGLYEPVPETLRDAVRGAFSDLPDGKEKTVVKKKTSLTLLLAAALAILSVTALATGGVQLFRHLNEHANPIAPLEGAEALVVKDLGRSENELVTVTVEEAVYDGQGAMVLARLTLKDPEHYAVFTDSLGEDDMKDYDIEYLPSEVGEVELLSSDRVDIVNTPDRQALIVDGVEVEIPQTEAEAEAKDYPVYRMDGRLYWTGMTETNVLGHKDGRKVLRTVVDLDTVPADGGKGAFPETEDPFGYISGDDELQPDGSCLYWFDCFADQPLEGEICMQITPYVEEDGAFIATEPIVFSLVPAEVVQRLRLTPMDSEALPGLRIVDARIAQSKVQGYMWIDYVVNESGKEDGPEERAYDFRPLDAGNRALPVGDGGWRRLPQGGWRCAFVSQALGEIPETMTLEVCGIDGEVIGRITCRVETE